MGMIWLNLHHRPCHLLRRRTFAFAWYPRHTRPLHEFALNTSLREQQNSHESMVHLSKQHMIVEDKRGDTLFYIDVHGLYISVFSQTKHNLNILEHDIFYLCMHVCITTRLWIRSVSTIHDVCLGKSILKAQFPCHLEEGPNQSHNDTWHTYSTMHIGIKYKLGYRGTSMYMTVYDGWKSYPI